MSRVFQYRMLWIVLLAFSHSEGFAQSPLGSPKVINWQNPSNGSPCYVTVMGEVVMPGTHLVSPQSLTLQSALQTAGGLTINAAGEIRIVRHDRIALRTYAAPQIDQQLQPGDLLIIESRQTRAAVLRRYEPNANSQPSAANSQRPAGREQSLVQLALLNVLDYPVLIPVTQERAYLQNLVQELGHPVQLASYVQIIGPDPTRTQAEHVNVQSQLSDCTVLIFPKGAINRNQLPDLPSPYVNGKLANQYPLPPASPFVRQGQEQSQPQYDPNSERGRPSDSSRIPVPQDSDAFGPPGGLPSANGNAGETPLASRAPRIATLPFRGDTPTNSSSLSRSLDQESMLSAPSDLKESVAEPLPIPQSMEPGHASPISPAKPTIDSIEPETPKSPAPSTSIVMLGLLLAGVAALCGIALLVRKGVDLKSLLAPTSGAPTSNSIRRPTATTLASSQSRSSQPNPLNSADNLPSAALTLSQIDQLIRNELPISEEKVVFPRNTILHGKIVIPPKYRVDQGRAGTSGRHPHFEIQPSPRESAGTAHQIESGELLAAVNGPHQMSPARPHFLSPKRGSNAATAEKVSVEQSTSTETPSLKHSATPLTDALRQLRGDGI